MWKGVTEKIRENYPPHAMIFLFCIIILLLLLLLKQNTIDAKK